MSDQYPYDGPTSSPQWTESAAPVTPPAYIPPPPSYAPPSYAPPSYAPPSYAPPSYAPPGFAPPDFAPQQPAYIPPPPSYAPTGYAPPGYAPMAMPGYPPVSVAPAPPASGLAIASMVLGILGFLFWFLPGIPAVICGHLALGKIAQSNGLLGGRGQAIAGLVLGYIEIGFLALFLVAMIYSAAVRGG